MAKNPFRRDESTDTPTEGRSIMSDVDQWFRPEPTGRRRKGAANGSNGSSSNGNGTVPASREGEASPHDDTTTIPAVVDDKWQEETSEIARVAEPVAPDTTPSTLPGDGPPPEPPRPKKKKKSPWRWFRRLAWTGLFALTAMFVVALVAYAKTTIPDVNKAAQLQTTTVFYSDEKTPVGRFGDVNRENVRLEQIPPELVNAVLAAENRTFYSDNGVSPKGIARALWVNLHGGAKQGGSTITQQYVKNYYLTQDRTWKRKIKEALLSIKIDQKNPKKQILEDYLNTIYLGRGAYGMQAAAKAYFNSDVSKLTPSQSVALASMIRSPGRYNPDEKSDKERLQARWTYVADSMQTLGTVKPEVRKTMKFPVFPEQVKTQSRYGGQRGYILTEVKKELLRRNLTEDQINNGGFKIITTIDPQMQKAAEEAVPKEFPPGPKNKGLRVGLVAVQPGTGEVKAMYGGKDFLGKDKYAQVNAATYPIQPGSTMKVFTTAALLEGGHSLNDTYTGRSPLKLKNSPSVRNEFGRSYGPQTIRSALIRSINTTFVDATAKFGARRVKDAMVAAGIPEDAPGFDVNARITIGIASIKPIYIADAYATLCGQGKYVEEHIVSKVIKTNGGEQVIRKPKASPGPVFSPKTVSETIKAMQAVVTDPAGTGHAAMKLGRPVAGKTGTHQDLTAWFTGCTPQLAASVVMFKDAGTKSLDGTAGQDTFIGGGYPTFTWTEFMKNALRGQPVEKFVVSNDDGKGGGGGNGGSDGPKDPYDTTSTVGGPKGNVTLDDTPNYGSFDLGSGTYTPKPTPTPTPKPTAKASGKPTSKGTPKPKPNAVPPSTPPKSTAPPRR